MTTRKVLAIIFILNFISVGMSDCLAASIPNKKAISMVLVSTAFEEGNVIPKKHTCDGIDVSPELSWSPIPDGTKSFVVTYTNRKKWAYWILYNIPAHKNNLEEAVPHIKILADGSIQGVNNEKWVRFVGSCPPWPQASYFTVYALDTVLKLPKPDDYKTLLKFMNGHILGKGRLSGRYGRKN